IASRCCPLAGTANRNSNAHTELRPDTEFIRERKHQTQFGIFLENRDDVLAEQLSDQQQLHHGPIFVAVADQERAIVFQMRKSRDQFRLRAAFESEIKRTSCLENLLNDFVKLIYFDRIDADIIVLVFGFFNCSAESSVELCDSRP